MVSSLLDFRFFLSSRSNYIAEENIRTQQKLQCNYQCLLFSKTLCNETYYCYYITISRIKKSWEPHIRELMYSHVSLMLYTIRYIRSGSNTLMSFSHCCKWSSSGWSPNTHVGFGPSVAVLALSSVYANISQLYCMRCCQCPLFRTYFVWFIWIMLTLNKTIFSDRVHFVLSIRQSAEEMESSKNLKR